MSQLQSRYDASSWEDAFHDGVVILLGMPRAIRACSSGAVDRVWGEIRAQLLSAVNGSVRSQKKAHWQVSIDDFSNSEGDEFDLLGVLEIRTGKDESSVLIPQDPGSRYAIYEKCRLLLEARDMDSFLEVANETGDVRASIRIGRHKYALGSFPTKGAARAVVRTSIRKIRDACLPIHPRLISSGALAKRRTNVEFWIAMARDSTRNGRAMPSFFYDDPLNALLLIEWMFAEKDGTYKIEGADQVVYNARGKAGRRAKHGLPNKAPNFNA